MIANHISHTILRIPPLPNGLEIICFFQIILCRSFKCGKIIHIQFTHIDEIRIDCHHLYIGRILRINHPRIDLLLVAVSILVYSPDRKHRLLRTIAL